MANRMPVPRFAAQTIDTRSLFLLCYSRVWAPSGADKPGSMHKLKPIVDDAHTFTPACAAALGVYTNAPLPCLPIH